MSKRRKPLQKELRLLERLIEKANIPILSPDWKDSILVQSMDDGDMGSLLLFPKSDVAERRSFGRVASEVEYIDDDGIPVLVSLNLDKEGELFEVDSWKVDFSSIKRLPDDI
ncbi:MAG: hypothetical protein ABL952_02010 [Pyrinomonadaceae bacterium]